MHSWLGRFAFTVYFFLMLTFQSSFGSCVGQFVLTASLRSQVNPANRAEFKDVSPERCVPPYYTARFKEC